MGTIYCKSLLFGSKEYDLSNAQMEGHEQVAIKSVGKFIEPCRIFETSCNKKKLIIVEITKKKTFFRYH